MFWEPTKQERKRRRVLGVVCVAIALWSCAETDAYLGDVPQGPALAPADASAEPDSGTLLMCVATECPEGLTTCPSDYGPTYKCSVDLRRDQNHCGACGHACVTMHPLHMSSRCVDGACALECLSEPRYDAARGDYVQTNFDDCNGVLDDGCEVDLFSDAANCGACGNACPGGAPCIDGQCGCPGELVYCASQCIDTKNDEFHCGDCDTYCDVPDPGCDPMPAETYWGCRGGDCEKLRCTDGFADCNDDLDLDCASDGCETPINDVNNCGGCGIACKADEQCVATNAESGYECLPKCETVGLTACEGGFCADILNDVNHCGGCLLQCPLAGPNQTRACKKGICELACAEGFGDCNGDPADGCETDLRSHPSHCGACGVSCDNSVGQPCLEGKCLVAPCEGQETR